MARHSITAPLLAALALGTVLACASTPDAPAEAPPAAHDPRTARLEREVERLERDLAEAEQALVTATSSMQDSHTRADAVSAVAEARIQVERAGDALPWNPEWVEDARVKLDESERQLSAGHLGAAAFFATRASHMAQDALSETRRAGLDDDTRRVRASRVNLRGGPSLDEPVLRVLTAGTPVYSEGRAGEWVRVRTLRGRVGWVHAELLGRDR